jgi:hypothetical protein
VPKGILVDGLPLRPLVRDYNIDYNNRRNVNANYRQDNGFGMALPCAIGYPIGDFMETYRTLYPQLYSYQNLELAFKKARKRKTTKGYVLEFESELQKNLEQLKHELESFNYSPKPMVAFVIRDPKTRKINASDFRDRVIHHAICNIIGPIFERQFIHDSFANQKGKGTHRAIKRAERFIRKVALPHATGGGGHRHKIRCRTIRVTRLRPT